MKTYRNNFHAIKSDGIRRADYLTMPLSIQPQGGSKTMRRCLFTLMMLSLPLAPASAQLSIGIGFYSANIGINLQLYPDLERVPGYPVYYAPRLNSNYFFYDGMYWVYQEDNWYAGSWYNGPWYLVEPIAVPYFVLRIPVRYYRQPPIYFQAWQVNAPPRWGDHWGSEWSQRHSGWDRWDRKSVPAPAPLPVYQRQYSGDRYPGAEQQQTLNKQEYRYQPREAVVRELQTPRAQGTPPGQETRPGAPQDRKAEPQGNQRSPPDQSDGKGGQRSAPAQGQDRQPNKDDTQRSAPAQGKDRQPNKDDTQRSAPTQGKDRQPNKDDPQRSAPGAKASETSPQDRGSPQDTKRQPATGKEKDRDKKDGRGEGSVK